MHCLIHSLVGKSSQDVIPYSASSRIDVDNNSLSPDTDAALAILLRTATFSSCVGLFIVSSRCSIVISVDYCGFEPHSRAWSRFSWLFQVHETILNTTSLLAAKRVGALTAMLVAQTPIQVTRVMQRVLSLASRYTDQQDRE